MLSQEELKELNELAIKETDPCLKKKLVQQYIEEFRAALLNTDIVLNNKMLAKKLLQED
jgi:hypothetical protein